MKSKVAIIKCGTYENRELHEALARGFNLLGGIHSFVKHNEKIVLKPNILSGTDPNQAVVTHPALFNAVSELLLEQNISLSFGDSPGGLQPAINAARKAGYFEFAEKLSIPFGDFDHGASVSFPDGITSKRLFIANAILESQGVISLAKLKSHGLTRLTGAVKNQYGCVPGTVKGQYHARFPDVYEFSRLLVDICSFVKPRLYIMDAIVAMEGNGPQSGEPRHLGAILMSSDPVALDATASRLVNLDPECIPTCTEGQKAGLGYFDISKIELMGDDIGSLICRDFDVVRMPPPPMPANRLARIIKSAILPRPVITNGKCTKCGRCVSVCPVEPKAVDWDSKKGKKIPPQYNYSQCIRCYCCHEMCPFKAIHISTPVLGKLLPLLSYISLILSSMNSKRSRKVRR